MTILSKNAREPPKFKYLSKESHFVVHNSALCGEPYIILKKREWLSSAKESQSSKLPHKRAMLALFFLSVGLLLERICCIMKTGHSMD